MVLTMKISEIKKVLSEFVFFRKTLKRYSKMMKTGKYFLFPTMRAMVVDEPKTYDVATLYFNKKTPNSMRKKLIKIANKVGFFKNVASSVQEYEAMYIANNYDSVRETKLFSFSNKKILTICANEKDYEEQIKLYDELHCYFNIPKIKKACSYNNAYEITMIDFKKRPCDEKALKNILFSVSNYNKSVKEKLSCSVGQLLLFNYEDNEINCILNSICSQISTAVRDLEIPICQQHGDLSRDNLIYGESEEQETFWWIDWEHKGNRVFFYDYFFYILNTALYFKDTYAFENYMNGNYNEDLRVFFESFGVEFYPEKLRDYFLVYFVAFLKERVCDRGNIIALKMYRDFALNNKLLTKDCTI